MVKPNVAQTLHPNLPVNIKEIVFKDPKFDPLTSIVISIPEIPFTGKLLTNIPTKRNLKTSRAF